MQAIGGEGCHGEYILNRLFPIISLCSGVIYFIRGLFSFVGDLFSFRLVLAFVHSGIVSIYSEIILFLL